MQGLHNSILSKKQLRVLELYRAGLTTNQIAHSINLSELTINIILKKINKKLHKA